MSGDRTLLRARWIYTGAGQTLEDHAVLVEGNKVLALLPASEEPDARALDLPSHLLIPGLINTHTHVAAGPIARSIGEDVFLPDGAAFYVPLSKLWALAYQPRFAEEIRAIARWDVLSMMTTGTTLIVNQASVDFEGYLQVAAETGVRTVAGPIIPSNVQHRLGTLVDGQVDRQDLVTVDVQQGELARFIELFSRADGMANGRIRLMLGPASAHTVDIDVLRATADVARDLGCPVTTHFCQAPTELVETQARYGMTPLGVLDAAGLLNERLICAHATYLPEADFAPMAASGASVAHCASRKAREARFTPFVPLIDAGIRVTLGTDAFNADLVAELGVVGDLAKVSVGSPARPTAGEVLDAATSTAAEVLGYAGAGTISPGALADLVAVDLASPTTWPVYDPVRALVYYSTGKDVDMVMVDGHVLVEEHGARGADVRKAAEAAEAACREIWGAAEREGLIPLPAQVSR